MRYGMMNSPFASLEHEIATIADLGFDYLELTMDAPNADHRTVLRKLEQLQSLLQEHDLGLICHMPTFVYLADLTPGIREASVQETKASLSVADKLGCKKVVLHPWFLSGLGPMMKQEASEHGHASLRHLLDHAGNLGLTVCLENLFPRAKSLISPDDFLTWFADYPHLQLTLDTGHANLAGGSNTILAFIKCFPDRIGHVHISDNRGRDDDHLPIGAGNIDFTAVVTALKDTGYNQTATFEVFTASREFARQCRERFEELWKK